MTELPVVRHSTSLNMAESSFTPSSSSTPMLNRRMIIWEDEPTLPVHQFTTNRGYTKNKRNPRRKMKPNKKSLEDVSYCSHIYVPIRSLVHVHSIASSARTMELLSRSTNVTQSRTRWEECYVRHSANTSVLFVARMETSLTQSSIAQKDPSSRWRTLNAWIVNFNVNFE